MLMTDCTIASTFGSMLCDWSIMYATLRAQPEAAGQGGVDLPETRAHSSSTRAKVVLPRIVGSVGQPQADDRRSDPFRDLDALEHVIDRSDTSRRRGVPQAPQHVLVILEEIWVDSPDGDSLPSRELS